MTTLQLQQGQRIFKPLNQKKLMHEINMLKNGQSSQPPIGNWDVSEIKDMSYLFKDFKNFNEDISGWNVSKVTNMSGMFYECINFNKNISGWDVSKVTNMSGMFYKCINFNQPLNNWDVKNVVDMSGMFYECINFNEDIFGWNVSKVTNMNEMFYKCIQFNKNISEWDVSKVTIMSGMFNSCFVFNFPLNTWKVGNVKHMESMFYECRKFNQPLNNWNVKNVKNMQLMFQGCVEFNQPLNKWNVRNVENMQQMFSFCVNLNQNFNAWGYRQNRNLTNIFYRCPEMNPDNYVRLLYAVDPNQIHKGFNKINTEKLKKYFKNYFINSGISLPLILPPDINFANFIEESLNNINENTDTVETEEKKIEQKNIIDQIMNERLRMVIYSDFSLDSKTLIYYALEFAKNESNGFKDLYIKSFTEDNINAYNGENGMSCAAGVLERIITSLNAGSQFYADNPEEYEKYKTMVDIINAKPIDEFIMEWFKSHNNKVDTVWHTLHNDNESKKADLYQFLESLNLFDDAIIRDKIQEYNGNLGYDKENFTYGGRKYKTRKYKTRKYKTKKSGKNTKKKTGKKINAIKNKKTVK